MLTIQSKREVQDIRCYYFKTYGVLKFSDLIRRVKLVIPLMNSYDDYQNFLQLGVILKLLDSDKVNCYFDKARENLNSSCWVFDFSEYEKPIITKKARVTLKDYLNEHYKEAKTKQNIYSEFLYSGWRDTELSLAKKTEHYWERLITGKNKIKHKTRIYDKSYLKDAP